MTTVIQNIKAIAGLTLFGMMVACGGGGGSASTTSTPSIGGVDGFQFSENANLAETPVVFNCEEGKVAKIRLANKEVHSQTCANNEEVSIIVGVEGYDDGLYDVVVRIEDAISKNIDKQSTVTATIKKIEDVDGLQFINGSNLAETPIVFNCENGKVAEINLVDEAGETTEVYNQACINNAISFLVPITNFANGEYDVVVRIETASGHTEKRSTLIAKIIAEVDSLKFVTGSNLVETPVVFDCEEGKVAKIRLVTENIDEEVYSQTCANNDTVSVLINVGDYADGAYDVMVRIETISENIEKQTTVNAVIEKPVSTDTTPSIIVVDELDVTPNGAFIVSCPAGVNSIKVEDMAGAVLFNTIQIFDCTTDANNGTSYAVVDLKNYKPGTATLEVYNNDGSDTKLYEINNVTFDGLELDFEFGLDNLQDIEFTDASQVNDAEITTTDKKVLSLDGSGSGAKITNVNLGRATQDDPDDIEQLTIMMWLKLNEISQAGQPRASSQVAFNYGTVVFNENQNKEISDKSILFTADLAGLIDQSNGSQVRLENKETFDCASPSKNCLQNEIDQIPANQWTFLAYTLNANESKHTMFVKNQTMNVVTTGEASKLDLDDSVKSLELGTQTGVALTLNGFIDDVIILTEAKLDDEINQMYELQKSKYGIE